VVCCKQAKWVFQILKSVRKIAPMKTQQQTSIDFRFMRAICASSLLLMAVGCGLFAASQQQYTITDLPSL